MPELPEMQALAERLDALLSGARLTGVVALQFSALKTFEPRPESLVGRPLAGVGRRGKYLVFEFPDPAVRPSPARDPSTVRPSPARDPSTVRPSPARDSDRILVHLSQGGRVFLEDAPKRKQPAARGGGPKGGVVRLLFADRPSVLVKEFGSQRKAAWWVVGGGDPGPLEGLGPEPYTEPFERLVLDAGDRRRVHTLLRDQRTVAGIGRGFADDILWRARLSPYESLPALSPERRAELVTTVRAVLDEALERERKRTGGLPAKLGERFEVHGRYGHPCPRCGSDLRRVSYESYEITYCPTCQTEGRTLADRRMSRLVK